MTQTPTLQPPTKLSPAYHPATAHMGAVWAHTVVWDVTAGTIDAYDDTGESVTLTLPNNESVRIDVVTELARAMRDAVDYPDRMIRLGVDSDGRVFSAFARLPFRPGLAS